MTPVERAARALCKCENMDPDDNMGPADDPHPLWWFYIERVEAVLQAIREPDADMRRAATDARLIGDDGVVDGWQAMIDAALGEA